MKSSGVLLLVVAVLAFPTGARTAEAQRSPEGAKLAAECDELIRTAVKRPYGWAWAAEVDAPAVPGAAKPAVVNKGVGVSFEPMQTPAAGLMLVLSGELLGEAKYVDAGRQVGRGVVAGQQALGRFPARVVFNPTNVGTKEVAGPLSERGPTRAALALLMTIADVDNEGAAVGGAGRGNEAVARAALRGAGWLMKQQVESGAWPVLYSAAGSAARGGGAQVVRLDSPDTRESAAAMLLAYEVMGDPFHRKAAERSTEFLMKARAGAGLDRGAGMWQTAYAPTALPFDKAAAEFPAGFDTLASRRGAQAMFDEWVVLGNGERLAAADLAGRSINDLVVNGEDGKWHRRFNAKGVSLDPEAPKGPFGPADGAPEAPAEDPVLAPTLDAVATAKELGREKYRARLAATLHVKRRLALVAAGAWESAMSAEFPAKAEEVDAWVKRHAATPAGREEAAGELSARVRRVWDLYLRALAERQLAKR